MDRDGTLIEHEPYLHDPDRVRLLPGTIEGLRLARDAGFMLFLFTNQSGVGRGLFSMDDVLKVNNRMIELIGLGPLFTDTCIAPEHPDTPSPYRKPSPRFILEMTHKHNLEPSESWMVGDSDSDWQAGHDAHVNVAAIVSPLVTRRLPLCAPHNQVPVFQSLPALMKIALAKLLRSGKTLQESV